MGAVIQHDLEKAARVSENTSKGFMETILALFKKNGLQDHTQPSPKELMLAATSYLLKINFTEGLKNSVMLYQV